ncbi:MAG: arylsulfatase [Chlamydiales bacterium]
MKHVDTQVWRPLDALEDEQLTDSTLVVLTADHGETLDEHDLFYTHGALYEEDLRIPLMVHIPGAAAGRHDGFVSTVDIVPTLEGAMGFQLRRNSGGLSLMGAILPAEAEAGLDALAQCDVFVHQQAHNHSAAVRQGEWKLWWPITGDESLPLTEPQLFSLREDPGETRNLFHDEPERAAALERSYGPGSRCRGSRRAV